MTIKAGSCCASSLTDPCTSYPCYHEGTCHYYGGYNYYCSCSILHTGRQCENGKNHCRPFSMSSLWGFQQATKPGQYRRVKQKWAKCYGVHFFPFVVLLPLSLGDIMTFLRFVYNLVKKVTLGADNKHY